MFIIVSVFNLGVILPGELAKSETDPAANSLALLAIMVPTVALVIVWWIGEFYDSLVFRFTGWLVLFTLVFFALIFLCIFLGIDRMLGFDVMYLVLSYVFTPLPALLVLVKIKERYCSLLNRELTKREKVIVTILCAAFLAYWFVVPWDFSRFSWNAAAGA
jgi:hypothetical protein